MGRSGAVLLVVCCALLGACLQSASVQCGDGVWCPEKTRCHAGACLLVEQFDRCASRGDGEGCSFTGTPDGVCNAGICFARGCGDGFITPPESCEPAIPVTVDCTDRHFQDPGTVTCTATCEFDTSACTGYCGDGRRGGGEACDGDDFGGRTCKDFGYYAPDGLGCTPGYCTLDLSGCHDTCGDGTLNGVELCEPSLPVALACVDVGYDAGRIDCSDLCAFDTSACRQINWQPLPPVQPNFIYAMWGTTVNDLWAVGAVGLLMHFNGTTWSPASWPTGFNKRRVRGIWGLSATSIWAVGEDGIILYFDGTSWSVQRTPSTSKPQLRGVWGTSASNVWAVGEQGVLLQWNGTSWLDRSSLLPTTLDLNAIHGTAANDIWVVGGALDSAGVPSAGLVAHYDGVWTTQNPGEVQLWRGVYARGTNDDVFIAGSRGAIRHLTAATWKSQPTTTTHWFNALYGYGTGEVVAVGNGGTIAHYDNRVWMVLDNGTDQDLLGVWSSGTRAWAGGESGTIMYIDNHDLFGRVYSPADSLTDLFAIHGTALDDLWVAGSDAFLAHFDGVDWRTLQTQPSPFPKSELIGLWAAPDVAVAVGAYDNGSGTTLGSLICEVRGPAATTPIACSTRTSPSSALLGVWGASAADLWAAGDSGLLMHYDGAWTSRSQDIPVAGIGFKDVFGTDANHVFVPGGLGELAVYDSGTWSVKASGTAGLIGVWASSATDVYAVGAAGAVLHYDGTFDALDSGTIQQLIEIHGSGEHVIATGRNGVVLERRASVWGPVQSPFAGDLNGVYVTGSTAVLVGDNGRILEYRWY